MAIKRGFGFTIETTIGKVRRWVLGKDGIKRWLDTGTPIDKPPSNCPRCGGEMKPGKALLQTSSGSPDFVGGDVVTHSPGGPGRLTDCLKCCQCGHSLTVGAALDQEPDKPKNERPYRPKQQAANNSADDGNRHDEKRYEPNND